jgi:hypothetical protein
MDLVKLRENRKQCLACDGGNSSQSRQMAGARYKRTRQPLFYGEDGQKRIGLPNDQYGRTLNTQEAKAAGYRAEPPPLYGGNLTPAHDWSAFDAAFHPKPATPFSGSTVKTNVPVAAVAKPQIQTAGTPTPGGTPLVTPIDPRYQAPGGPAIGITKYPTDVTAFDRARPNPIATGTSPGAVDTLSVVPKPTPETNTIAVQRPTTQVVAPAPAPVAPVSTTPVPTAPPAPTPQPVAAVQAPPAPTPAPAPVPAAPVAAPTPPAVPLPSPAVQAQSENDPYRSKLRRGIDDEEEQYA